MIFEHVLIFVVAAILTMFGLNYLIHKIWDVLK